MQKPAVPLHSVSKDTFHLVARNRAALELSGYFLEKEGFCVSGLSLRISEALRHLARHRPAVLVVGSELPDGSGLSLMRQAHQRQPSLRRILFLHGTEPDYVRTAYDEGIDGLLSPDTPLSGIRTCLQAVQERRRHVCPLLQPLLRPRPAMLTNREKEVLEMVRAGLNSVEIGVRLAISPNTVANHRAALMRKLGLQGRNSLEHRFSD